jgi:protein involved in polysaccharide export with SLBB domain
MRIVPNGKVVVRLAAAVIVSAICGPLPQPVLAQTAPNSAQLETFRNLPRSQQQAVLDALNGPSWNTNTTRRDAPLANPPTLTPLEPTLAPQIEGPPKIGSRSTLLIAIGVREAGGSDGSKQLLDGRRERVLDGNPYQLDGEGRLALPICPPINLSGLTSEQAGQLLTADPRLSGMSFSVTLLPVEPVGADALKPFGYDLFTQVPTTFAPTTDIPVPADYRVGPGDNLTIDLFGKRSGQYQLVVNRNGALIVPEFGPIQVTGLSFDEVRGEIIERVSNQMIGVRASVTMGQLRSIRVFVVGDVTRAGAYTVSALSTITNALFASGGISKVGSLRNIELKRNGRTISRFDLYDLLLEGNTSRDQQLEHGDAIFVPAIGSTAAVMGQVQRPAIYELGGNATVGQLIEIAGGMRAEADPRVARLERIDADHQRTVINLDLSATADRNRRLQPGDLLTVPQVLDAMQAVKLEGSVERPGAYAWRTGMRLTDLLGSMQAFKQSADQRYVIIRRERAQDRGIEVLSADATRAFQERGTNEDPLLEMRDRVIVFGRQPDRGPALAEILQELRLQARDRTPMPSVTINGRVRAAGQYPLEADMTVADLIRAGGGLEDAAYAAKAELTRYEVVDGESRQTEVKELDLAGALAQAPGADVPLRAYDVVLIKELPDWRDQETITVRGEVKFPGIYSIRRRETLRSVVARAGGLTDAAFSKGSVFTRRELVEQETKQIETLSNRLQSDLAFMSVRNGADEPAETREMLAAGQSLLTQLKDTKPTGRLVIDLNEVIAKQTSDDNIELRDGDQLLVPRLRPYVTVIGEVQNSTSHVWKPSLTRDDYVRMSGGTTPRADDKRVYVVRANGSVVTNVNDARWFRSDGLELEPGDTVVVPIDTVPMRPLATWTAVTTIAYNMAVAIAAIGSL